MASFDDIPDIELDFYFHGDEPPEEEAGGEARVVIMPDDRQVSRVVSLPEDPDDVVAVPVGAATDHEMGAATDHEMGAATDHNMGVAVPDPAPIPVAVPARRVSSSRRWKVCKLCGITTDRLRHHVVCQHLPWYVSAHTACWRCEIQEGTPMFS